MWLAIVSSSNKTQDSLNKLLMINKLLLLSILCKG